MRATARWDPETRKTIFYKEEARPPSPDYREIDGCQVLEVKVPLGLVARAVEKEVDWPTVFRVGGLKALTGHLRTLGQDPASVSVRSDAAQTARALLGASLRECRKRQGLTIAAARQRCCYLLGNAPGARHGWSEKSYAAWEAGRSTPPLLGPLAGVLVPTDEEAANWVLWWEMSRSNPSGQPMRVEGELPDRPPEQPAPSAQDVTRARLVARQAMELGDRQVPDGVRRFPGLSKLVGDGD